MGVKSQNSLLSLLGNSPLTLPNTEWETEINMHYSFEFNNYNIFYPVIVEYETLLMLRLFVLLIKGFVTSQDF
jgi:hypothetical protein